MKNTVIYHSADFDGIFCREIARKFLPPDTEFIGWDHKDNELPFPSEGLVYVLDLSPDCFQKTPADTLERLVWIDHHKTAIENWPSNANGYRIDGVAACRLAWFYFTARERYRAQTETADFTWFQGHYPWASKQDFVDRLVSEPLAVRLAGEYDVWDKRDARAELFQHGLRAQELTPELWGELLADIHLTVLELLRRGESLQFARLRENASIIKELGFTFQWEGLTWLACNAARYNSLLFTAGLKPEHDGCFGFKWTGREWSVSLYHAPGHEQHDLSAIAKKFGGGGHRGACGFQTKILPCLT